MKISTDLYLSIKDTTSNEYYIDNVNNEKEEVLITSETLESMLEDLICEVDRLKEELEDINQDIQDNYNRKNDYDIYGISESDFR